MIKKIFHTADWHLRNIDRHEEFKESIDLLLGSINSHSLNYEQAIICITGDIFDNHEHVSNEANLLMVKTIKRCLEIHPVCITIGNHDLPKNRTRMDAITPIVEAIGDSNLCYSKYSEIFNFYGINFAHYSFLDNFALRLNQDDIGSDILIGLYHAPLRNCKNPLNPVFEKKMQEHETESSLFNGCSVVLMGDIHYPQKISHKGYDCYYCGSLYQQNFGEYVHYHGYGILDVETLDYSFIELTNSYGKYKLKIKSYNDSIKNVVITNLK
jgi:DNA repair exonuclease SbcCD nuclease subunit